MSVHDQALLHLRWKNYSAITQRSESNLRSNHHSPALIKSSSELSPVQGKKVFWEKLWNLGPCSPKPTRNYTEKTVLQIFLQCESNHPATSKPPTWCFQLRRTKSPQVWDACTLCVGWLPEMTLQLCSATELLRVFKWVVSFFPA